jgi:hypothetical protein
VHGDYRLDNLIIAPDAPKVAAVLDWELSTLGDPLADFSYHLMGWHMPHSESAAGTATLVGHDLNALGIPSMEDYVAAYVARTSLDPRPHLPAYLAYNFFRIAAILQGIIGRVRDGTATSEFAPAKAEMIRPLADKAWEFAQQAWGGSAPRLKEIREQRGAFAFGNAAIDLRPMVAGGGAEKADAVFHRPALRIDRAEIKPAQAGKRYRRRTHRAGLQRHIEIAIRQPLAAERARGLADREQFRVRAWVPVGQRAIAGTADHIGTPNDPAADRHFAARAGGTRFVEGQLHVGRRRHEFVMSGLAPAIRVFYAAPVYKDVDARHKPA